MRGGPPVCTACSHENPRLTDRSGVPSSARRPANRGGYSIAEVADFLDVDPSSVRRWVATFRRQGVDGLAAPPGHGRPPKLTSTQEKIVGRWLADKPTEHGFATELWTAPRLAQLSEQELGVHFHPDYLTTWLRRRGFTP